jgi:FkbM family methyltransferase
MTEMINAKLNGQFDIVLPMHRADRPEWYSESRWEKKRLQSMAAHIGPGDVVFYIGSEEGEMPALCSIWGADVLLFEPNPKVWPNTRVIWEANKLKKPLGWYVGFASNSTAEGPPELDYDDSDNDGWPACAYGPVTGDHGFRELAYEGPHTRQIKIDDYVARTGIIPTALSIDVEGSEWEVLRGAEQTLLDHHPTIWLSGHPEFLYAMFGEYLGDLRRWLKDRDYRETLLDYQHEVHLLYTARNSN